ncbi:MAG: molybdopterin-dependent oxidoreductase [bacterium]|nr:molybdopterin-dependent oxidoreductase [bacterium]
MKKPAVLTGALWGALFTLPLLAVLYVGLSVAGLPFAPFEMFDWIARALPGGLITFGIDTMVSVIIALGLPTSETAKTAEQLMAIVFTIGIGAVVGAIFFAVMNATQKARNDLLPGLVVGLGFGLPLYVMGLAVSSSVTMVEPLRAAVWTLGVFVAWGYALSLVWNHFAFAPRASAAATAPNAEALDRRRFLVQMGAGAAVITVVGAGVGTLLRRDTATRVADASALPSAQSTAETTPLPNAGDSVQPAPGTRPEVTPIDNHYRIDINTLPPAVAEAGYVLPIVNRLSGSSGETVREFTLDEIRAMPPTDAYITMSCISNRLGGDLISTTRWTGVSMQYFLEQVGVPEGATHLRMVSADGFDETVALDLIANDERVMLTWAWDGEPLRQQHGFPLRIHIPDLYGMKQPKWITLMEFLDRDEDGYWVRRGWDKDAVVRATSVIDTVAVNETFESNGATFVPVGGIAWAGDRGISAVQVRVDNGAWEDAQVRAPISDRTWVLWRYDWAFAEGSHTFEVRCTEGDGTPQIEERADVRPSGATGIVRYSI